MAIEVTRDQQPSSAELLALLQQTRDPQAWEHGLREKIDKVLEGC